MYPKMIRSLALTFFMTLALGTNVFAEEINIKLPHSNIEVVRDNEGYAKFVGTDIQYLTDTGEPEVPFRVFKILLPPDVDPSSVSVSLKDQTIEEIQGEWEVRPVPPMVPSKENAPPIEWPKDKVIVNGMDVGIYDQDAFFPERMIGRIDVGKMRKWHLVDVPVVLYPYNPSVKRLYRLAGGTISVRFERDAEFYLSPSSNALFLDRVGEKRIRNLAINFQKAAEEYEFISPMEDTPQPTSVYVIITTQAIANASDKLDDFIASKELRGFTVHLIKEETWGGGSGDAAAENIRNWLKENYLDMNIEYVLLIGDPDPASGDVPMKMLWPRKNATSYTGYDRSPSDFYYADLTGNWDRDGDGDYGEWSQDFGSGGVDRNWEVLVGRIPYYGSMNDLDHILGKIIDYENTAQNAIQWRRNAILPMEPSDGDTPGYHLGEEIKDDVLLDKGNWGYHRIYDANYGLNPSPETVPCSKRNVRDAWNDEPFGLAVWWTHGSATSASDVMDTSYASQLNDDYPSFTFQVSCDNAYPERDNNLAYSLLKNGGIGTIGASRVSWYYLGQTQFNNSPSNSGMGYEYARRMVSEEMESGFALYDLKQTITPVSESLWMNFTDFSLYGCPAVGLYTASGASPPVSADLSLSATDNPDPVAPEGTLTYTVDVENAGPSEAVNVTLTGELSSKIQNRKYSMNGGASWQNLTGVLDLGNLQSGGNRQVLIKGTIASSASGAIITTCRVESDADDPDSGDNSENEETLIQEQVQLAVEKEGAGSGTVTSSPSGISCGADCTETYEVGTQITLSAAPNADSVFVGWSGGGCSGDGNCALTLNENLSVVAEFALKTYTINASAGSGGSIAPNGAVKVDHGSNEKFTITVGSGYHIADVKVDGASKGAINAYTFTNVTKGHTIQAIFAVNQFTITASAGTGGTINPLGVVGVSHGTNKTFTITPNLGYSVADVKVDNVSKGVITSFTFANITANHTIHATFAVNEYNILASAGAGGTINPLGVVGVNHGTSKKFTITPNPGYHISNVRVDGVPKGAISSYTFTNVTADHTIQAIFGVEQHTITASAGTGGSIAPNGAVMVNHGANKKFTITAGSGYRIASVKVDGASKGAITSYTFTNVTKDHTIQAIFAADQYTITASAGTGGSIAPSGAVKVDHGTNKKFTITPKTGYQIANVKVDGALKGAITSYTFTNITKNHTIQATFVLKQYTITASVGTGGSIAPSGAVKVDHGTNKKFTITPKTGYQIANVKVDGASKGAITSYTFTNVTKNHTIRATFVLKQYTITASVGTGGSIAPSGAVKVNHGTNKKFTITPKTGYRIASVKVDGASKGAITSYTFTNVTKNHTIRATFVLKQYTITASVGTGGSIAPSGAVKVNHGTNKKFTITPKTGYQIANVKVDGASKGAITSYTFTNVTKNHTIQATFAGEELAAVDVGSGSGVAGGEVTVPITLTNVTGIEISEFTVDIAFETDILQNPQADLGPAAISADKKVEVDQIYADVVRVRVYSPSNHKVIGQGIVAYVTFDIEPDASIGSTSLANECTAFDPDGNGVPVSTFDGEVEILEHILGDCDFDGSVSDDEVQNAIDMFLASGNVESCCDGNGDDETMINEVQQIVNNHLEISARTAASIAGMMSLLSENASAELPDAAPSVKMGQPSQSGGKIRVPLIFAPGGGYQLSAIAIDVWYDTNFFKNATAKIGPCGTDANKEVFFKRVLSGVLRIGVLSDSDNGPISDGELVYLELEVKPGVDGTAALQITPSASDPAGKEVLMDSTTGTIPVKKENGHGISPAKGTIGTQFTINGSGFGAKRPKVTLGGKKLKVLSSNDTRIVCLLKKGVSRGKHSVTVRPKKKKVNATAVGTFEVMPPQIGPGHYSGSPKDRVTISGDYFGTKKGKVYIGSKKCKVKSWSMTRITFEVHKKLRKSTPGVYLLKVTNKVGSHTKNGFTLNK